jgi:ribose 5-phosphate isomerase B
MTMGTKVRLLVGSDSAGFDYKDAILADMKSDDRVESVEDLGVYAGKLEDGSYPSVAIAAGTKISAGEADRAILVCGTGIGVAIAANKVPGIRAAVIHDTYVARQGVEHDDVNVACIGAWVIGRRIAEDVVTAFLSAQFSTDPDFRRRVQQLADMEAAARDRDTVGGGRSEGGG